MSASPLEVAITALSEHGTYAGTHGREYQAACSCGWRSPATSVPDENGDPTTHVYDDERAHLARSIVSALDHEGLIR